jgi:hypothetical protein
MTNNKKIAALEITKEMLWLCISILISFAMMYPITRVVHYSMMWLNGLFLVVGLTYFRYAITLRTIYLLRSKWVRFALIIFNINFFVFVLRQEQAFMNIYDSYTIEDMGSPIRPMSLEAIYQLFRYFYTEINFAVVACLCMTAVLSVRMILAYWQTAYLRLNAGSEE